MCQCLSLHVHFPAYMYFSSPRRRPPLYKLCASAAESECTLLTVARKRRAFCDPIPAHPVYKRRRRLYKGFFPPSFSPACSKAAAFAVACFKRATFVWQRCGELGVCMSKTVARERKRERNIERESCYSFLCSVQRCSILQSIYVYKRVSLDVSPAIHITPPVLR